MAESISPDNPPYLTLTISQALSLTPPPEPEPAQHESVNAMLDARAAHMPDALAVGFTHLTSGSWGCQILTYGRVASLAHNLAGELETRLPSRQANSKSPNGTPLVAVLSPSGLQLFAHIVALWRLGYGVLCIAPGSTAESIANLLRLTETRSILAHASQRSAAQSAIDTLEEKAGVCEMLSDINSFIDRRVEPKSGNATGEDVLVTMHTSGSSGLPKPIYQLHRFWTASMLTAPGSTLSAFTTTPLFHGGMSDLLRSIQAGSSIFFHPTADPGALSASAICDAITACPRPIAYFLSVPYILDLLFNDKASTAREMLAGMELVSTGGAPLPQALGDAMVRTGIKLVSRLGSSECGFLMSSWRPFADDLEWNFLRIPDRLGQSMIRFEPFEGDLFELVVAKEWPTKLVSNRDDGAYATSDLYAKHPKLGNTWKYDSRADDTLVLVSGKKASAPIPERRLKESPLVTEAIAFGANRAIIGALVFVTPDVASGAWDDETKIKLLQQLQPVLKQINDASPPHAQLASEMVCLLPPSEAANIPRASKGTLQRGRAYQHYAALIDSVYLDFEEGRSLRLHASNSTAKETLSGDELVKWLQRTVKDINGRSVELDTDLFVAGVDSIQSARIRAAVHQNVDLGGKLLDRNAVYEYPTVRLLAQHIEGVRSGSGGVNGVKEKWERETKLMRELVDKYSSVPPQAERQSKGDGGKGTLFVLTGVTGGLGAQVLAQVLATLQPEDEVVCLVRASNTSHARQRLLDALSSRHLDAAHAAVAAENSQVQALHADLSLPDCGLPPLDLSYARVVTIHAAWSVNFVASLSSFEAENIAGLSHLIALHQSLAGEKGGCFTFASSVASILACPPGTVLSERLSSDPGDAVAMGYARSKWVAEQIVSRRFPHGGARVVRIGQLCADTTRGVWNESEAWPILISLSCRLGVFPRLEERLDWISTDVAARTVLDIATTETGGAGVYNVAQPTKDSRPAPSWQHLFEWLHASGLNIRLVAPQEWLDRVAKSDADHRGLLSLWQKNFSTPPTEPTRFDCRKALDASAEFRAWQETGVTQELIQKTVARWKEIGFLS